MAVGGKLSWLNFLYVFSYVKLAVTLVKYIPQVCVFVCVCACECLCVSAVCVLLTGGDELQKTQYSGVEYRECTAGFHWRGVEYSTNVPHLIQLW